MLHVRLVVPSDLSDDVEAILDDDAVVNIVWHHDVVRRPTGDLVTFDLVPEAANRVVNELRGARVDEEGSIMIDRVATSLSRTASIAIALNPGDPSESVLWEEVKERVTADSTLTMTWLALVVVAVQIAAVGLLTDSAILMVGAMAVGPDFGPVASIAIALRGPSAHPAAAASSLLGFTPVPSSTMSYRSVRPSIVARIPPSSPGSIDSSVLPRRVLVHPPTSASATGAATLGLSVGSS